jgi:hypothetical protein
MSTRLHLPHPHISDRFIEHIGEGFWAGMFHHHTHTVERAVPAATDWDEWHYAPAQADWENDR